MEPVKPGQRFVTMRKERDRDREWVVDSVIFDSLRFPHVRVRRADDLTTQKLLALSVLMDQRVYRPVNASDTSV